MREVDGMKQCSKCKATKPVAEYHHNFGTADGYQSWCKACIHKAQRALIEKRQEKNRAKFGAGDAGGET